MFGLTYTQYLEVCRIVQLMKNRLNTGVHFDALSQDMIQFVTQLELALIIQETVVPNQLEEDGSNFMTDLITRPIDDGFGDGIMGGEHPDLPIDPDFIIGQSPEPPDEN